MVVAAVEPIDELVEKGKRRALDYKELLARREARAKKLELLDQARTHLLMYFVRAYAVNQELTNELSQALLLSLLPQETSEQGLVRPFTEVFGHLLDDSLDCLSPDDGGSLLEQKLLSGDKLSKTEYMILFGIYLRALGARFRFNFKVRTSLDAVPKKKPEDPYNY